jgi:hypothetical protein
MRSPARLTSLLLGLGWSAWFLWDAFGRWRLESICAFACPAYLPEDMPEYAEQLWRSMDWQTPLMLAALPLAALVVWWLLCLLVGLQKT